MNENALTDQLVLATLGAGPRAMTQRFLTEVVGVQVGAGDDYRYLTQARWEDAGQREAIVVAIAPAEGLSHKDIRYTPGSCVDGAILAGTAVLLESKIAGMAEHAQLVRHARHWALDIGDDPDGPARPLGDGFALRTWRHVHGWLGRELERNDNNQADRQRLETLAAGIASVGLGAADASLPAAPQAQPVSVDHPRPVATAAMTAGVDLRRLAIACYGLYGRNGSRHVSGNECRRDAAGVASAFERAGQPVPGGLNGNPMTPRRVLSVLYAEEGLRDAAPAAWTELRGRLLPRGADRTVLLALLAWADANPGTTPAVHLHKAVPRIWPQTPAQNPGFEELHAAVAEAS